MHGIAGKAMKLSRRVLNEPRLGLLKKGVRYLFKNRPFFGKILISDEVEIKGVSVVVHFIPASSLNLSNKKLLIYEDIFSGNIPVFR